ncbi:MAG: hypothetical protein ACMUIM_03085 [bacterium]
MKREKFGLKVIAFLVALLLPVAAFGFVSNGNFEAGAYIDGNDVIPVDWVKVETLPDPDPTGEISYIYLTDDNGPGGQGENACHFSRTNGGSSGDWTAIRQEDLDVEADIYPDLELWLDVKALDHNLCGGGQAGAWEYPISVVIHYLDSGNNTMDAQVGWYLATDSACDATEDWQWWESSGRWAKSRPIDPDTWYTESIDLQDPNLDMAYITGITVGGAGWDFEGRVDNVGIFVILPIDIKPGSYPNSINLKSNGVLPVAILTTDAFDALRVDPNTVTLGDLDAGGTSLPVKSGEEDVDDDGDTDLILHFSVPELVAEKALNKNSTEAVLTGETFESIPIRGRDSVRIVPPAKPAQNRWGWSIGGLHWGSSGFGGPPWSVTGSGGPPWFQTQTGGPRWFQTGVGGPWWGSRIMSSSSTNFSLPSSNFGNGTIGFKGTGNGTLGPPWYQSNVGGPQWFQTGNGGPWWNQAASGVPSVGPKWYQTQTGGPRWFRTGNGGPWWASNLP